MIFLESFQPTELARRVLKGSCTEVALDAIEGRRSACEVVCNEVVALES
jgi:hypothetical protein